jgi:hypothetical protein
MMLLLHLHDELRPRIHIQGKNQNAYSSTCLLATQAFKIMIVGIENKSLDTGL